MNLRGHVSFFGSPEIVELNQLSLFIAERGEPEVWDLRSEFVVLLKDENVLEFQITVSVAFEVDVPEALADFFEKEFNLWLSQVMGVNQI